MKLPTKPADLTSAIRDLIRRCEVSQSERQPRYQKMRRYMLYGSDTNTPARFNKMWQAFRLKASFLYSHRSLRFTLTADPADADDAVLAERLEIGSEALGAAWHESDTGRLFSQAVLWGCGFGAMFVKFGWRNGLRSWLVNPGHVGVLREQLSRLVDQEALTMTYYAPKAEVERVLKVSGKSEGEIEKIMKTLTVLPGGLTDDNDQDIFYPVITSTVTPTIMGAVTGIGTEAVSSALSPQTQEPLVEMRELYVYDDTLRDYRLFTVAQPGYILFDRPLKDLFIPHELPLLPVIPMPLYDYFWGYPQAEQVILLQDWREKRFNQLDTLFERQLKPPVVAHSMSGLTDEKYAAAMRRGGVISAMQPNSKMEFQTPQLPPESFAEIEQLDAMFDKMLNIREVLDLQGAKKGDTGAMTALASSPLVESMLEIESILEKAGEIVLKLLKQEDKTVYKTELGGEFTLAQLPDTLCVEVAAHSSSPLFAEALRQEATNLLELGIADPEGYLELTDPPMKSYLLTRLKARTEAEQKEKQQEIQMFADALKETPAEQRANILENFLTGFRTRFRKK